MKCPHDNSPYCTALICLEDTKCGARKSDGAPNYEYFYTTKAIKLKKKSFDK